MQPRAAQSPSRLERAVRALAPIRPGEGLIALALALDLFLILCAYYALKTVREGLILAGGERGTFGLRGAELKTVATGAMAVLLLGVVPAYGWLASRVSRLRLISLCYALVLASLAGFCALGAAGVPVGLAFYLWLGVVNVFLVGQFWSYASDLCTEDQGRRLFAAIAVGGSAGAILGPRVALAADVYALMAIAGAMLAVGLALFHAVERLGRRQASGRRDAAAVTGAPVGSAGGFRLIAGDGYLMAIAALLLVANLVNTVGELILARAAVDHAAGHADPGAVIKAFYADFYSWVNLAGFVVQALIAPRLLARTGPGPLLFVLPAIALGGYGAIGVVGGLAVVRATKLAENAVDYSLQNTVRQALFLPVRREAKYQAKAAIDTFFVRAGDLLAALLAVAALAWLELSSRELALVNCVLAGGWLVIAAALARRHARLG